MTNSLTLQQESEMIDVILHKSFPIPTVYQYTNDSIGRIKEFGNMEFTLYLQVEFRSRCWK